MWYSRLRTLGVVIAFSLLIWIMLAEASTNAFVEFRRRPINEASFVEMVNNQAYFRDALVGGVTSVHGATDGETWAASAILPDGTPIQWFPGVTFSEQLGDKSNCFSFSSFFVAPDCNTTSVDIIWFTESQCRPTGAWNWSFTNNGNVFATPQFTLLPEVPGVPLLNQGFFTNKKYDNICYVVQVGSDGKSKKVTVPCSTPGATNWDIKAKGCVLVDAVMVLQYHGVTIGKDGNPVTVENLDAWLSDPKNRGYDEDGGLDLRTLSKYSQGKIAMSRIDGADDSTLRNSLCSLGPVIIPVNSPTTGKAGHHSVVAIGRDDPVNPKTWKVNDPDGGSVTTLLDKQIYGNKYYGLRIFKGPGKTIDFGGITIKLFSPAELLVTDFQGRRTGFDPITNTSYREIPQGSYGDEGLEDLTSDSPGDEWKEFDVSEPADGRYETTVTGTAIGTYDLRIRTWDRDGEDQGIASFDSIPTAPGVVQKYTIDYSGTPGTPMQLSGGFDGHGQRPSDVNKFLSYANPSSARTQLPAGETTFALLIFYDKAIRPQTFKATINGADITALFTPTPGNHERVNLPLVSGSTNTLVLSVEGTTTSGRVATDTDRLVILVK